MKPLPKTNSEASGCFENNVPARFLQHCVLRKSWVLAVCC